MNCPGRVLLGSPPSLFKKKSHIKSNGCSLIWKLNRFQRTSDREACNGSHTVLLPMILKTITIGQINQVVLVDENHDKISTVYWLQAFMRALFLPSFFYLLLVFHENALLSLLFHSKMSFTRKNPEIFPRSLRFLDFIC